MRSFTQAAVEVLRKRGPMEVFSLVRTVLKFKEVKKRGAPTGEHRLAHDLCLAAIRGEHGLRVAEYPLYRLKRTKAPNPPSSPYVRWAVQKLLQKRGLASLRHLCQGYKSAAVLPEFWMYSTLEQAGRTLIERRGKLRVGLSKGLSVPTTRVVRRNPTGVGELNGEEISQSIDEQNLESLLVENLERVERGLVLIQRQYSTPVGRIDLLCRDRRGNLVVIEIKRLGASRQTLIDQITGYIGWVKENKASYAQKVRGIIIVGKLDQRLKYSVRAIPHLEVKYFDIWLRDAK